MSIMEENEWWLTRLIDGPHNYELAPDKDYRVTDTEWTCPMCRRTVFPGEKWQMFWINGVGFRSLCDVCGSAGKL
jgi:rubredoxin